MNHDTNHRRCSPPDRQEGVLDTQLLRSTSFLAIGVGRSLTALEELAAARGGRFAFIEPQSVEEGNIGQSGVTRRDLGRPKAQVAARRVVDINPDAITRWWECKAEEVPNLADLVDRSDIILVGVDDLAAMFWLADLGQEVGVDTIVAGTSGDCSQHFVAFIEKNGSPLRTLIPDAWEGLQAGYRPPSYFPSARIFADTLNVKVVLATLGVLHYRANSDLLISEIGRALMHRPLIVGSNGVHGDFFNPARMFGPNDLRGA